jgi:hypothetical protein
MTPQKLTWYKAYREAHKEQYKETWKRYYEKHGIERYYENLELSRATRRKSYYKRKGDLDAAQLEQERIDQIRLSFPRKRLGAKPVFSPEEAIERRKATVRRARYRHVAGITDLTEPDKCEICGRGGKICLDHDHKTNAFRGWICDDCNIALARVREDVNVLNAMIKYIEKGNSAMVNKLAVNC